MINKSTGGYMLPLSMPQVANMLPVNYCKLSEVANMLPVMVIINNLAKVISGRYTPHLHNHTYYIFTTST